MQNKINSNEISVIVQGPVSKTETLKCLKSVRRHLPEAEIILSTWKGSDISSFDGLYNILVENEDPGAFKFSCFHNKQNNINRMIVSTKEGLKRAKRTYCLKIRSDMFLKGKNFLKEYFLHEKRCEKFKLFSHRIIAYPYFSVKFHQKNRLKVYEPFHISDWCYFGLTEDLVKLYDIDTVKEPDFSEYFIHNNTGNHIENDLFPDTKWQFPPEQYTILSCIKKYFSEIKMCHRLDITKENIEQSELFIINNFKFLDSDMWQIYNMKTCYSKFKLNFDILTQLGLYSYSAFLIDYQRFIDKNSPIPLSNIIKYSIANNLYFYKLKKSIARTLKLLPYVLGIFYYSLIFVVTLPGSLYKSLKCFRKKNI